MYSWGRAVEGQLGNGTENEFIGVGVKKRSTHVDIPSLIPSLSGLHVRTVTCGDCNTACVLAHGMLYTWGEASLGKKKKKKKKFWEDYMKILEELNK